MKNNDLITLNNVIKNFEKSKALDDVSFSIPKNSIFGLLGPNGSGKSTLMRILSGLIIEWDGEIFFENQSIKLNQKKFLQKCGFLIENPTFYEYLTARQNLSLLAKLSNSSDQSIKNVLHDVDLVEDADRKVGDFSYGMKQRLGIAQAILHNPDILFLDEPNNRLDPLGIREMNKAIFRGKQFAQNDNIHMTNVHPSIVSFKEIPWWIKGGTEKALALLHSEPVVSQMIEVYSTENMEGFNYNSYWKLGYAIQKKKRSVFVCNKPYSE